MKNTPFNMKTNTKKTLQKKNLPHPKKQNRLQKNHTLQTPWTKTNTKPFFIKKLLETKRPNLLQNKQNRLQPKRTQNPIAKKKKHAEKTMLEKKTFTKKSKKKGKTHWQKKLAKKKETV